MPRTAAARDGLLSKDKASAPAPERRKAPGERVSRVDSAYREIRRRILDNEYPQGHQALEQELAAELGMSRTPVREALVRLQNESFVQLVPRHGMRVVPLSVQDLKDMYEVLTVLELAAIDRLARNRPDADTVKAIEGALDEMDRAIEKEDLDAWVKADERFHRTLVDRCGNARLSGMADVLWDQGHRARITTVQLRPNLQPSNREHRQVFQAIRRGDWRTAKDRHASHRARTSQEIIGLLEKLRLARL